MKMILFLSVLFFTTHLFAGSIQIFEKKKQDGSVEFSDHPTPGAKKIQVDPNVVEVPPIPVSEPQPVEDAPKPTTNQNVEPQVIDTNPDDDEVIYINNRRLIRDQEIRDKVKDKRPVTIQPRPANLPARVSPK